MLDFCTSSLQSAVGNSLKYRKKSILPIVKIYGSISCSVDQVFIEDNGIGFDECYCQQIFSSFERQNLEF